MFNKYDESLFKFYFSNFLISLKIYKDINLYKNLQSIHHHPRPRRNGKKIPKKISSYRWERILNYFRQKGILLEEEQINLVCERCADERVACNFNLTREPQSGPGPTRVVA